jgi:hypothetical protein
VPVPVFVADDQYAEKSEPCGAGEEEGQADQERALEPSAMTDSCGALARQIAAALGAVLARGGEAEEVDGL